MHGNAYLPRLCDFGNVEKEWVIGGVLSREGASNVLGRAIFGGEADVEMAEELAVGCLVKMYKS
jgi:hypothetical protein